MLRHQRRRLEGDCLTAVPLIKCAEVSPLSWGSLFSLHLVTETAGDHTLTVFLNSPRLLGVIAEQVLTSASTCWGFGAIWVGWGLMMKSIIINNMAASKA